MIVRSKGANRRKECVPYTPLSYRVQQTRLDVHRTLARVPTARQNTADDNDNDTLGELSSSRRQETHAPWHGFRQKQATHALRTKTRDFKMESQRQETKTMNNLTSRTKPPDTQSNLNNRCKINDKNREPRTTYHRKHNDRTRNPTPTRIASCRPMTKTRNHTPQIAEKSRPQTDKK